MGVYTGQSEPPPKETTVPALKKDRNRSFSSLQVECQACGGPSPIPALICRLPIASKPNSIVRRLSVKRTNVRELPDSLIVSTIVMLDTTMPPSGMTPSSRSSVIRSSILLLARAWKLLSYSWSAMSGLVSIIYSWLHHYIRCAKLLLHELLKL